MNVSIRQLKNNLSKYVHLVREGQPVVITDRNKPVAQISELPDSAEPSILAGVDWRRGKPLGTVVRLLDSRVLASDIVLEERR